MALAGHLVRLLSLLIFWKDQDQQQNSSNNEEAENCEKTDAVDDCSSDHPIFSHALIFFLFLATFRHRADASLQQIANAHQQKFDSHIRQLTRRFSIGRRRQSWSLSARCAVSSSGFVQLSRRLRPRIESLHCNLPHVNVAWRAVAFHAQQCCQISAYEFPELHTHTHTHRAWITKSTDMICIVYSRMIANARSPRLVPALHG